MSHKFTKIKYKEEGAFGSTKERTLYCRQNKSCDITCFYNDKGECIFCFEDTLDDNIFEKMVELINNWKDNPNIETCSVNEFDKIINIK